MNRRRFIESWGFAPVIGVFLRHMAIAGSCSGPRIASDGSCFFVKVAVTRGAQRAGNCHLLSDLLGDAISRVYWYAKERGYQPWLLQVERQPPLYGGSFVYLVRWDVTGRARQVAASCDCAMPQEHWFALDVYTEEDVYDDWREAVRKMRNSVCN